MERRYPLQARAPGFDRLVEQGAILLDQQVVADERGRVALEALMSGGALASRRHAPDNQGRTALDTIMDEVDDLSGDHHPAPEEGDDHDDGQSF